jgi:hypothetical protein
VSNNVDHSPLAFLRSLVARSPGLAVEALATFIVPGCSPGHVPDDK